MKAKATQKQVATTGLEDIQEQGVSVHECPSSKDHTIIFKWRHVPLLTVEAEH